MEKNLNAQATIQERIAKGMRPPTIAFEWLVVYQDGSELKQNYGIGREKGEHDFGDIDEANVERFCLVDKAGNVQATLFPKEGKIKIKCFEASIVFPKGENMSENRIIYYRRTRDVFNPDGIVYIIKYLIGLQKEVDGKNFQQIITIAETGEIELMQQR